MPTCGLCFRALYFSTTILVDGAHVLLDDTFGYNASSFNQLIGGWERVQKYGEWIIFFPWRFVV